MTRPDSEASLTRLPNGIIRRRYSPIVASTSTGEPSAGPSQPEALARPPEYGLLVNLPRYGWFPISQRLFGTFAAAWKEGERNRCFADDLNTVPLEVSVFDFVNGHFVEPAE